MSGDLIIKRKKVVNGGGHHGGAWKVAYADFVTAMMAFFLLMWLLNATTEDQRKGIADYFDPSIPISQVSGGGSDVLSGDSIFAENVLAQSGTGGANGVRGPSGPPREGAPSDETRGGQNGDSEALSGGVTPAISASAATADFDGASNIETEAIKEELMRGVVEAGVEDGLVEHLFMRETPEGLVIEIVDQEDSPLFSVGSASSSTKLQQLLGVIADVTKAVVNDIAIVGHTDASAFRAATNYSNWELSSDRALEARRILVGAGTEPGKVVEVSGKAASSPLLEDPYAPQNRRISITLLRN